MSAKEFSGVGSECLITIDDTYVQWWSYVIRAEESLFPLDGIAYPHIPLVDNMIQKYDMTQ